MYIYVFSNDYYIYFFPVAILAQDCCNMSKSRWVSRSFYGGDPWTGKDVIGLDIGGVCSVKLQRNKTIADWDIYTLIDPGVYPYLMMFKVRYDDFDGVCISSRTTTGKKYNTLGETFVTKIVRSIGLFDLGLTEDRFHICTQYEHKASWLNNRFKGKLRCFIDDHEEVLQYIHDMMPSTTLLLYSNDSRGPVFSEYENAPTFDDRSFTMRSWLELAHHQGLIDANNKEHLKLWDEIQELGPPFKPHSYNTLHMAINRCMPHQPPGPPPQQAHAASPKPRPLQAPSGFMVYRLGFRV